MRVLLDTCVLSEVRNPQGNQHVREAFAALYPADSYLSVISLGEIRKGIALLPESRKRNDLADWLYGLVQAYSANTLPVDADTATIWGEITAKASHSGYQLHATDGLIAATAIQHGLHVMTRNVRHFEVTGVLIVNPWV